MSCREICSHVRGPLGLLFLTLYLSGCARLPIKEWPPCDNPVFDTQGHRGARAYRPENTLPAMEYALAHGVRTLEMDLSVTRDNVLVLSHDPYLLPERCLSPGGAPAPHVPIHSLTLAELQTFDCGSLRNPRFPKQVPAPGTAPPTLAQVLSLAEEVSGGTVHYNIEIKSDPSWDNQLAPPPDQFTDLLLHVLTEAGVAERTVIQSFDLRPLEVLHNRGAPVKTSLLVGKDRKEIVEEKLFSVALVQAEEVGAAILSPEWHLVSSTLVQTAHSKGIAVIPWTVNDAKGMNKMISLGVDGLISDDVNLLVAVSRSRSRALTGQGMCGWQ